MYLCTSSFNEQHIFIENQLCFRYLELTAEQNKDEGPYDTSILVLLGHNKQLGKYFIKNGKIKAS